MPMESAVESPLDVLSLAATMVRRHDDRVSAGASNGGGSPREGDAEDGQQRRQCLYLLVPADARQVEVAPEDVSPLDMRSRHLQQPTPKGQPQYRPSVITCAPATCRGQGSPPSSGRRAMGTLTSSGDDPDIDEHFRRSLGSDYVHLFSRGQGEDNGIQPMNSSGSIGFQITGNSVDDHFAKALGDTWRQLQQLEEEVGLPSGIGEKHQDPLNM